MKTITRLLFSLLLVSGFACGGDDDGSANDYGGEIDAGGGDQPDAGGEVDCYENPTTHNELINACTDAEAATDKDVDLPLLNDDGTVPDPLVCQ